MPRYHSRTFGIPLLAAQCADVIAGPWLLSCTLPGCASGPLDSAPPLTPVLDTLPRESLLWLCVLGFLDFAL